MVENATQTTKKATYAGSRLVIILQRDQLGLAANVYTMCMYYAFRNNPQLSFGYVEVIVEGLTQAEQQILMVQCRALGLKTTI